MKNYLSAIARILLSQIFLLQVILLVGSIISNPSGYEEYLQGLGNLGLPGIFAPLIILINFVGGIALLLGFKTRFFALFMAIWAVILSVLLHLPILQYLAISGGLLILHLNPQTAFSLDNRQK